MVAGPLPHDDAVHRWSSQAPHVPTRTAHSTGGGCSPTQPFPTGFGRGSPCTTTLAEPLRTQTATGGSSGQGSGGEKWQRPSSYSHGGPLPTAVLLSGYSTLQPSRQTPEPGSNRDEAGVQLHARAEERGGCLGIGQASAKTRAPILLRLGGNEGDGSNIPHPPPHNHSPTHAMGTDGAQTHPVPQQRKRAATQPTVPSAPRTSPQTRSRSPLHLPAQTTPEQHRRATNPQQQRQHTSRNMRTSSSCSTHR